MYGVTRATLTLIGVAVAGFLLWLAAQVLPDNGFPSSGDHWAAVGLIAVAGLTMSLSQLLGGWTKWGWPRVSGSVFLLGFLPTLIAGGWILAASEPGNYWFGRQVRSWTNDLGIDGLVGDLTIMSPAIAFGIGLVFGFTFDTTGPRIRKARPVPVSTGDEHVVAENGSAEDRRVRIREGESPAAPQPDPAPQSGEPQKE
jgi:hypothetical protein